LPAPREAAELIVKEERSQKAKTPAYPGLDDFSLEAKMGE